MPITNTGPLAQQQMIEEQNRRRRRTRESRDVRQQEIGKRRRLDGNQPLGAPVDSTTIPTKFPSPAELMQQRLAAPPGAAAGFPAGVPGTELAAPRRQPGDRRLPPALIETPKPPAAPPPPPATTAEAIAQEQARRKAAPVPPTPTTAPTTTAEAIAQEQARRAAPQPPGAAAGFPAGVPGLPAKPQVTLPFLPAPQTTEEAIAQEQARRTAPQAPPETTEAPPPPATTAEAIAQEQARRKAAPVPPTPTTAPTTTAEAIAQEQARRAAPQTTAEAITQEQTRRRQEDEQSLQQAFDEGGFESFFKKADELSLQRQENELQKAYDIGGYNEFFKKADELSGGVPPDISRMADGTLSLDEATTQLQQAFDEGGFDKFFETADKLVVSTATTASSEPTPVETAGTPDEAVTAAVPAVDQPDPSTVAQHLAAGMDFNADTYAQSRRDAFQKQVDEGAMRLARRFALEIDPTSGEAQKFFENYYAQVAASRNELEASIQTEIASIQQGNLAAVTDLIGTEGQLEVSKAQLAQRATEMFGGEGTSTLSSLGVPTKPAKYETTEAFAQSDPKGFKTWINRMETSFYKTHGRMPTDGELESLANGQAVIGRPTLQYQQMVQDNAEFLATQQLQREEATGLIQFAGLDAPIASLDRERINETSRQFNETEARMAQEWADKYGLDEAQVEEMLKNAAWQREETARINSFTIAQQLGELTGVVGFGAEDVTAGTFGIQTEAIAEDVLDSDQALAQTPQFAALKSAAQSLLGRDIADAEALALLRGESIKMQGVPTLQARQLAAEVTRSNMQMTIDIERIAAENNLKADELEYAREQDARAWNLQTGRVSEEFGIPTDRFRIWKFGLDKQLLRAGSEEERQGLLAESMETFLEQNPDLEINAGDLVAANELFDQLYGNDQMNIARQRGMEDQQWQAAKRQMDLQQEQQEAIWAGALGFARKYQTSERINIAQDLPLAQNAFLALYATSQGLEGTAIDKARRLLIDPNRQPQLTTLRQELSKKYGYMTDDQLASLLSSYLTSAQAGTPGVGVALTYLSPNWLDKVTTEEQQLLMAIVNRSAYSPEREGNAWLEAGLGLGQTAATLLAGRAGRAASAEPTTGPSAGP